MKAIMTNRQSSLISTVFAFIIATMVPTGAYASTSLACEINGIVISVTKSGFNLKIERVLDSVSIRNDIPCRGGRFGIGKIIVIPWTDERPGQAVHVLYRYEDQKGSDGSSWFETLA